MSEVEKSFDDTELGDLRDLLNRCSITDPNGNDSSLIRFRAPYIRTCVHDARGDAIALIVEQLTIKDFPLWASYAIAIAVVDVHAKELQTANTSFVAEKYDPVDASTWCKSVIQCMNSYLIKLASGSLALPKKPRNWDRFRISYCAQRNRRSKMEDRIVVLPTLSVVERTEHEEAEEDALFAVFDGHNGVDCAVYASTHFHRCLVENDDYPSDNLEKVMRTSFDAFDKRLSARCEHEKIKSGTAAVCALLRAGKRLCIGWCGDSAAAVLRESNVYTLSSAHSPNVPEEMRRIEEAGGLILTIRGELRVNGVLNLTRSLGDLDARPMISPEPDVISVDLDGTELLLLLACDGIWDVFKESEVHAHVVQFVRNNPREEYAKLAEYIAAQAKEAGSTDNLSLICVFLIPVAALWDLFSNH